MKRLLSSFAIAAVVTFDIGNATLAVYEMPDKEYIEAYLLFQWKGLSSGRTNITCKQGCKDGVVQAFSSGSASLTTSRSTVRYTFGKTTSKRGSSSMQTIPRRNRRALPIDARVTAFALRSQNFPAEEERYPGSDAILDETRNTVSGEIMSFGREGSGGGRIKRSFSRAQCARASARSALHSVLSTAALFAFLLTASTTQDDIMAAMSGLSDGSSPSLEGKSANARPPVVQSDEGRPSSVTTTKSELSSREPNVASSEGGEKDSGGGGNGGVTVQTGSDLMRSLAGAGERQAGPLTHGF